MGNLIKWQRGIAQRSVPTTSSNYRIAAAVCAARAPGPGGPSGRRTVSRRRGLLGQPEHGDSPLTPSPAAAVRAWVSGLLNSERDPRLGLIQTSVASLVMPPGSARLRLGNGHGHH